MVTRSAGQEGGVHPGGSDRNIWLKGGGLLDEEYNPKPVYNTIMRLINEDWMTRDLVLE